MPLRLRFFCLFHIGSFPCQPSLPDADKSRTLLVLDTPGKLGKILIGMNKALGEVPVTIKLRSGVRDGRNTAHKLMPRIASEWGVGCMTVSNICYSTIQLHGKRHKLPLSLAEPRVHLTIDGRLGLTFTFFATRSVAWTHATTEISETCGLGLHQRVRCCCTREGSRLRL